MTTSLHLTVKSYPTAHHTQDILVNLRLESILRATYLGPESGKDRRRDKLVLETFRCRDAGKADWILARKEESTDFF